MKQIKWNREEQKLRCNEHHKDSQWWEAERMTESGREDGSTEEKTGRKRQTALKHSSLPVNDSHCAIFFFYQRLGLALSPSHIFSHDPPSQAQGFFFLQAQSQTHAEMVAGMERHEREVSWAVVTGPAEEICVPLLVMTSDFKSQRFLMFLFLFLLCKVRYLEQLHFLKSTFTLQLFCCKTIFRAVPSIPVTMSMVWNMNHREIIRANHKAWKFRQLIL